MTTPILKPYIRSTLPLIPGSERVWSDNEYKKLEQTLKSVSEYVSALEKRLAALEAKG